MRQQRMTPPRSNPRAGVSGAALSPAKTNVVIPAPEIIALRIVPKTTTIPSSKTQRRRMQKQASTMMNSSSPRIPSNKSASSAGL